MLNEYVEFVGMALNIDLLSIKMTEKKKKNGGKNGDSQK